MAITFILPNGIKVGDEFLQLMQDEGVPLLQHHAPTDEWEPGVFTDSSYNFDY